MFHVEHFYSLKKYIAAKHFVFVFSIVELIERMIKMAKKKLTEEEIEAVKTEFDYLFSEFYPEYAEHRCDGTLMEHIKANQLFANKAVELMNLGKKIGIDVEQYIHNYGTEHDWK